VPSLAGLCPDPGLIVFGSADSALRAGYAVPSLAGLHPLTFANPALPCRATAMPSLRDWFRFHIELCDGSSIVLSAG
jgi:hypothetical protein